MIFLKGCKKNVLCFYVYLSVDHPYLEGHNLHASSNILFCGVKPSATPSPTIMVQWIFF